MALRCQSGWQSSAQPVRDGGESASPAVQHRAGGHHDQRRIVGRRRNAAVDDQREAPLARPVATPSVTPEVRRHCAGAAPHPPTSNRPPASTGSTATVCAWKSSPTVTQAGEGEVDTTLPRVARRRREQRSRRGRRPATADQLRPGRAAVGALSGDHHRRRSSRRTRRPSGRAAPAAGQVVHDHRLVQRQPRMVDDVHIGLVAQRRFDRESDRPGHHAGTEVSIRIASGRSAAHRRGRGPSAPA